MKSQYKYISDFNRQNYDQLNIYLPKGKRDQLKQFAIENGESVNKLINRILQTELNMTDEEWNDKAV